MVNNDNARLHGKETLKSLRSNEEMAIALNRNIFSNYENPQNQLAHTWKIQKYVPKEMYEWEHNKSIHETLALTYYSRQFSDHASCTTS